MHTRQNRFLQFIMQTSEDPVLLEMKRAEGIYLITEDDQEIIDMISGIGVSSLGHGRPEIISAIKKQSEMYLHSMVYGEFVQSPQVELAELITSSMQGNFESVFFVNSGSEAIEGALKLAKRYTKRTNLVAMNNAYHGSTHGALSLMSDSYFSSFYRPLLPGVRFLNFNSLDEFHLIDKETAAVVVEPIQGEAGYIPANENFLKKLRERCNEVGALLIFDEIQTGMGRTGSLFAYEQYGVEPDILCTAKAFGAGMPLAAFISSRDIGGSFKKNPVLGHITTFGGHPVSCAAALAGLKLLLSKTWMSEVAEKETLIRSLLLHEAIKTIDGIGLMLAVELPNQEYLQNVVRQCLEDGLMIDWFLYADHKLRIAPPLVITNQEIEKACKIILSAIAKFS
jgi:acetylornithine/N-succinyldiaminopimelate aminotransferase